MIKKLAILLFVITTATLNSCESTGICIEPVTPKLMIGFSANDELNNEESINPPDNLKIFGNRDGENIIVKGSIDDNTIIYTNLYPSLTSVNSDKQIPLLFDVNRDSLTYILNFDYIDEDNKGIYDTLKLKYTRKQIFIGENCGYKSIFYDVLTPIFTNNKIENVILLSQTIEYDTEQHIKIYLK